MNVSATVVGSPAWLFIFFLGIIYVTIYNWRRRHLYYYASKIPGPFSLPLIGSVGFMLTARKNFLEEMTNLAKHSPPVFKVWIGPMLHFCTSRPEDIEVILNTCLERSSFYRLVNEHTTNSLLTSPVSIWKKHRQLINHSFNPNVVNSFFGIFHKNAKNLVEVLDKVCGKEESDLTSKMWLCNLTMAHETLADVDSSFHSEAQKNSFCRNTERLEKITVKRFLNVFYFFEPLWKMSALRKEAKRIAANIYNDVTEIIDHKLEEIRETFMNNNDLKSKRFLNYVLHPKNRDKIERDDLESQVFIMCVAASETNAMTLTSALVVLGICQDVQEMLFQEISTIYRSDSPGLTLEKVNKMGYLERVLKETMRLFPGFPFILRYIDKDIQSGSYVFPAGSNVCIFIGHIHKDPNLWPNPLKFDPDRFLPEEVAKRHRCAYLPFSFGPRNCIGFTFAMLSMKVLLAEVVRNFKIKTLKHKSVEELKIDFHMMAKLKDYTVVLEKRKV